MLEHRKVKDDRLLLGGNMKTYLYRYEVAGRKGVARVTATGPKLAAALVDKLVLRESMGQAYFIWALN